MRLLKNLKFVREDEASAPAPERNPGLTRRGFLEMALAAAVAQACGGVREELRTALKDGVKTEEEKAQSTSEARKVDVETAPEKRPTPFEYIRQALEKLPPFPANGTLGQRVKRAKADNKMILDIISTHIEEFAGTLCKNEPMPWEMLKQIPYPDLEENLGAIENITFVWDWFSIVSHLVQSDVVGRMELVDEALSYMQSNLGTVFHDDAEAHAMSNEAELMEVAGRDPRLLAVLASRFKRGINRDSGSNRLHEKASLVRHLPTDANNEETLPPTEELSWGMLVVARSGKKYREPALKLTDPEGRGFALSPADLVPIAQTYCRSLIHFFEVIKRGVSEPNIELEGKYKIHNNFTERGAHLIHGVLVLLGKYGQEIKAQEDGVYEALVGSLKKAILLHIEYVNKGLDISAEEKYDYAGHLLQAILDDDAAAIFEVGGKVLNGGQVVKKYAKNLEMPLNGNPQSDLEIVAWACQWSASDLRPLVMKCEKKPGSIAIKIGHTAAGLEKLAAIME